jgi:excisionase family DNA binding protein
MTEWLTTEQAGDQIGMTADYVARQCASGAIRAKKLGTEWRIAVKALEQFMGSSEPAPAARKRSARQMRRAS